jgi:hypothetical protein
MNGSLDTRTKLKCAIATDYGTTQPTASRVMAMWASNRRQNQCKLIAIACNSRIFSVIYKVSPLVP